MCCAIVACAAPPSVSHSEVGCGPCEARADGFERVVVRAQVRTGEGRPVAGIPVLIGSAIAISDGYGEASAVFASHTPGKQHFMVRLADGKPLGSVTVAFFSGSLPRDLYPKFRSFL